MDPVADLAARYLELSKSKGTSHLVAGAWLDLKEAAGGHAEALAAVRALGAFYPQDAA